MIVRELRILAGCAAYALHIQSSVRCLSGTGDPMNKKSVPMPKFRSESEEADWWASPAGRAYVKQKSAQAKGRKARGSSLVAMLNKKRSVQIAIRLPEADLTQARQIAERKGIGYQPLLKMLVREGLVREARRG